MIGNLVLKWYSVLKAICFGLKYKFLQDTININSIVSQQTHGKHILQNNWIRTEIINLPYQVDNQPIKTYVTILKIWENKFHKLLTNISNTINTFVSIKMMLLSSSEKERIIKEVFVWLLTYQQNHKKSLMESNFSDKLSMLKFGFKASSLYIKDIFLFLK